MKGIWKAWEKIMDPENYEENFSEEEWPEDKMDRPRIQIDLIRDKVTTYCYKTPYETGLECDIFVDITENMEFWLGMDRNCWQFTHFKDWLLTLADWEKQKFIEKYPDLKGVIK